MQRPLHRVSCKVAIYDPTRTYVLLVHYTPTASGIPGGHMEPGESPDNAMRRELEEELGYVPESIERKDFFLHTDGKVILGYVATSPMDWVFHTQPGEASHYEWVSIDDIRTGKRFVDSYGDFITRFAS